MRLLLDTHVAIWTLIAEERLPDRIKTLISEPSNSVYVSVVTVWEIAVKRTLNRAGAPPFSAERAIAAFSEGGFLSLDITNEHAARVEGLPLLQGDPFDRLLIAQALSEPLRLVTHDKQVAAYSDSVILF